MVSAQNNLTLLVLIYVEKEKKKWCSYFFLFFLVGFSKLLPKANNRGQILQISLHIYSIFSIGGSFYLLFPLPSRSLNQQTPPLSPLLESVFPSRPLSTFISFLIPSTTW